MRLEHSCNQLPLSISSDGDSSEVMKGNLVLVQNSTSSSALSSSSFPLSSTRFTSQVSPSTTSISRHPKRLLAVVKVYRKSSNDFAVVNFVGRQQIGSAPMYVNLRKYNVHQATESNKIVLDSVTIEGSSLTFEATNPAKASKWTQAFGRPSQSQGRLHTKVLGDRHFNTSPTAIPVLEEISEEICESESENTTSDSVDKRIAEFKENSASSLGNSKNSSVRKTLSSRPVVSSNHTLNSFSVSRKPFLPVLSESSEEDEEMSSDEDYNRFSEHRLD